MEQKEPRVLLGPIIGKVTESTARVLLEVDHAALLSAQLQPEGDQKVDPVTAQTQFQKGVPSVFRFQNLQPGVVYRLKINGVVEADKHIGRVTTFNPQSQQFRIVAASCDNTFHRGKVNMYEKLWETVIEKNGADLMIRHGDQAYCDPAYKEGLAILKDNKIPDGEKDERILEAFRKIYRLTWSLPEAARVYRHVSSLMMWDDHEIRNDWGTFPDDRSEKSAAYRVGKAGRKAFWQYQRQLWDDIIPGQDPSGAGLETHMHVYGKVGLLFVDNRGSRSFGYDAKDKTRHLGERQFELIQKALEPQGVLGKVDVLIPIHSMPAVYLSECASSCMYCCMKDKMGIGSHPQELFDYLGLLENWKSRSPNREAFIISGDLHIGIRTEIRNKKGDLVMRQMVASPISNKPPNAFVTCFLSAFCMWPCCKSTAQNYTFKHVEMQYSTNFGLITVNAKANGKPEITDRLVSATTK